MAKNLTGVATPPCGLTPRKCWLTSAACEAIWDPKTPPSNNLSPPHRAAMNERALGVEIHPVPLIYSKTRICRFRSFGDLYFTMDREIQSQLLYLLPTCTIGFKLSVWRHMARVCHER
ncbi:hypothetical protein CDAR_313581 [Caerostris darwini]|uniref:Uncharacterized protein n=1 Tax=Caerostris darwini TaxID=1538125 RepID=A0AAV4N0Q8_9ARAC|nr:hypothetical protein CDAR_313581 [Caerostris darwini]